MGLRNLENNCLNLSRRLVTVFLEVGEGPLPPPPTSYFRNNLCKDDSELFSRFLHVRGYFISRRQFLPSSMIPYTKEYVTLCQDFWERALMYFIFLIPRVSSVKMNLPVYLFATWCPPPPWWQWWSRTARRGPWARRRAGTIPTSSGPSQRISSTSKQSYIYYYLYFMKRAFAENCWTESQK